MQIDLPLFEALLPVKLLLYVLVGGIIYGATLIALWILSKKPDGPEKAILNTFLGDRFGSP